MMITHLRGTLAYKSELLTGGYTLVVDVNGVGYQVMTSARNYLAAPATDAPMMVYTSMIVREDALQLVGFFTREERDMYDILSTASGVGPKVALALLSELSVSELASAIMASDFKRLSSAKGVGPKLAQKIAIELKDKLSKWRDEKIGQAIMAADQAPIPDSQNIQEAETVLLSLGYDLNEIHDAVRALTKSQGELVKLSSEEILQQILKWLAANPV